MHRIIGIVGKVYLALAAALIVLGYLTVWYNEGFSAMADLLSPYNVVNVLVVGLTIAPGLLLLKWSEKLKVKALRG